MTSTLFADLKPPTLTDLQKGYVLCLRDLGHDAADIVNRTRLPETTISAFLDSVHISSTRSSNLAQSFKTTSNTSQVCKGETSSRLLSLPNELLVTIIRLLPIRPRRVFSQTNRRLHELSIPYIDSTNGFVRIELPAWCCKCQSTAGERLYLIVQELIRRKTAGEHFDWDWSRFVVRIYGWRGERWRQWQELNQLDEEEATWIYGWQDMATCRLIDGPGAECQCSETTRTTLSEDGTNEDIESAANLFNATVKLMASVVDFRVEFYLQEYSGRRENESTLLLGNPFETICYETILSPIFSRLLRPRRMNERRVGFMRMQLKLKSMGNREMVRVGAGDQFTYAGYYEGATKLRRWVGSVYLAENTVYQEHFSLPYFTLAAAAPVCSKCKPNKLQSWTFMNRVSKTDEQFSFQNLDALYTSWATVQPFGLAYREDPELLNRNGLARFRHIHLEGLILHVSHDHFVKILCSICPHMGRLIIRNCGFPGAQFEITWPEVIAAVVEKRRWSINECELSRLWDAEEKSGYPPDIVREWEEKLRCERNIQGDTKSH